MKSVPHARTPRRRRGLALGVVLVAFLFGMAAPAPSASAQTGCAAIVGATCQPPGLVEVSAYDFGPGGVGVGDGVIDTDELQCAIDCLDADLTEEHSPEPDDPSSKGCIDGGVLLFDPELEYLLDRPVNLPACSTRPLILEGNGAVIRVVRSPDSPTGRHAAIQRIAPPTMCVQNVQWMLINTWQWSIRNLSFVLDVPTAQRDPGTYYKGVEVHGSGFFSIQGCGFRAEERNDGQVREGFDVAVEGRLSAWAVVEDCVFLRSRRHDVLMSTEVACLDGRGGGCFLPAPTDAACAANPGLRCCGSFPVDVKGSGSDHVALRSNLHVTAAARPLLDGPIALALVNSSSLLIEEPRFLGERPLSLIGRRNWSGGTLFSIRSPTIALAGASTDSPFILNDGAGILELQGGSYNWPPGEQLVLSSVFDLFQGRFGGEHVVLRDLSLGDEWRFRSTQPSWDRWSFDGVESARPASASSYWQGDDPGGGRVPKQLVQDGPRWHVLPRDYGTGPSRNGGELFLKTSRGRWNLSWCCADDGELLIAQTCAVPDPSADCD